jgi:glycosyltransferase involved in cell wall biosynthesis
VALKALERIKEDVDVYIIQHGVDFVKTLSLASSLGVKLTVLPRVLHDRMNEYYWAADLVIDRFTLGSLGMVSLEAIACGRPVVAYVSSDFPENDLFPLKDIREEKEVAEVIRDSPPKLWEKEHAFLMKYHDVEAVVNKLVSIYKELS